MRQFTHPILSLPSPIKLRASAMVERTTAVCSPPKRLYSLHWSPRYGLPSAMHSVATTFSLMMMYDAESPRQFSHFFALHPQKLKDVLASLSSWRAPKSIFPTFVSCKSINHFTSALCAEERVGIVENGYNLGSKFYPSFLRPNLRLAGPGIHGQTGYARSKTGSDTCVQYALPDQGPEGAVSWSRITHHFGRDRLTLASPPRGLGKAPLTDCGGFVVSPRSFHTPVRSNVTSR